ncbi:Ig domain-containing protein [Deinococcus planocerae]|uniref:Ig domain-containing protein n=1 Tax=Deinococcus planocerae TaxID=1737569 RepID=UPI001FE5C2DD|nr:Ig domain-containing protein [Deinococcus planocerae]
MRQLALRRVLPVCALLTGGMLLVACGSTTPTSTTTGTSSTSDPLYFTTTSLPVAYLAETYDAPVGVAGGAGPYSMRVGSGTLPPGLTLRGGRLSGTPTKTGTYTFAVEAADANLSTKVQTYTLNIGELPPLALKPQLPSGEIRGETRIPLNITAPRTVRAARMTWDLPEGVAVTRVQPAEGGGVLFWKQAGRTLTVDVGFKTVPRNGARVALVSVKPPKAVTLDAGRFAFEARDGTGKVLATSGGPAPAPASTPSSTGTGTTTAPGSTGTSTSTGTQTTPGTSTTTSPGTSQSGGQP